MGGNDEPGTTQKSPSLRCSTWGTRSFHLAGTRLSQRSRGSDTWPSAEISRYSRAVPVSAIDSPFSATMSLYPSIALPDLRNTHGRGAASWAHTTRGNKHGEVGQSSARAVDP